MFLEILQNSHENTCARVSFSINLKVDACNFIQQRLCHRRFPVNFAKFLRTTFLQNTFGRLLLSIFCTVVHLGPGKRPKNRSSSLEVFCKKAETEACNFILKRDSGTGSFPVNIVKHSFYRTPPVAALSIVNN